VRPDEAIAADLESSAARALARGGTTAAAAFLARAAVLTPNPQRKATRALAAAQAKLRAGAPAAARDLLALARSGVLDEFGRARADLVQAQITFASSRVDEALPLLLATARRLVPLDAGLARETFLDALSAAMFAGRLASGADASEVAVVAQQTSPPVTRPPGNVDLLLHALVTRFTGGYRDAVAASRDAVRAFRQETAPEEVLRWSWLASALAAEMWDDEGWTELVTRHVWTARAVGALAELPLALNARVVVHTCPGELDAAALLIAEIARLQEATGSSFTPYGTMTLAAWQGRAHEAVPLIEAGMEDALESGEGIGVAVARRAEAVLHNDPQLLRWLDAGRPPPPRFRRARAPARRTSPVRRRRPRPVPPSRSPGAIRGVRDGVRRRSSRPKPCARAAVPRSPRRGTPRSEPAGSGSAPTCRASSGPMPRRGSRRCPRRFPGARQRAAARPRRRPARQRR
jgi:hypothetical protein